MKFATKPFDISRLT